MDSTLLSRVDVVGMVTRLERFNIFMGPVEPSELGDRHAVTSYKPHATGKKFVFLDEGLIDALYDGGRDEPFARGVFAHELGHVVLHVDELRKRAAATTKPLEIALAFKRRDEVKAFTDPEWQAHRFAAFFLAPRWAVERLCEEGMNIIELARFFGVTPALMRTHLRHLKLDAA